MLTSINTERKNTQQRSSPFSLVDNQILGGKKHILSRLPHEMKHVGITAGQETATI